MTDRNAAIRTIDLGGRSALSELRGVAKAVFHVVLWSALAILSRGGAGDSGDEQPPKDPFELQVADLPPEQQRLARAIGEGLTEAEADRLRRGSWPSAEELAQDGIPPFAPDPLDRAGYRWTSAADAELINYIGAPSSEAAPRFAIIIREPSPGAAPPSDANQPDDRHLKLADGSVVHVEVWRHETEGIDASDAPVSFVDPQRGWRRVVVREIP